MRLFVILPVCALLLPACSSPEPGGRPASWQSSMPPSGVAQVTPVDLLQQEVRLYPRLISKGSYGRRKHRPMQPRYITIHATENYTGDAFAHAAALRNGKLR